MSWVPPRTITSDSVLVTVQGVPTGDVWDTLMGMTVADTAGWSIDPGLPTARGFKHFECDPLNRGTGRHVTDTSYHWYNTTQPMDFSCDGYSPGGPPAEPYHTCWNWSGKCVYDPVKKRVMMNTKGTGSGKGEWRFSTLSMYRLGHNEQEGWFAIRGFKATTPREQLADNGLPTIHFFDNNCIDLVNRRAYKKMFQTTDGAGVVGPSGPFVVFDLDADIYDPAVNTGTDGARNAALFYPSIHAPTWDAWGMGAGPADFVPQRGTHGKLWYANGGPHPRIVEHDVAPGYTGAAANWIEIVPNSVMTELPGASFNVENSMGCMNFNPRALGGTGAMFVSGGSNYDLVIHAGYMVSTPPSGTYGTGDIQVHLVPGANLPPDLGFGGGGTNSGDAHVCRHPTGDGWLFFPAKGTHPRYVWSLAGTPGSDWVNTGVMMPLSQMLAEGNPYASYIEGGGPVCSIEEAGVIWMLTQRPATSTPALLAVIPRAWLYKP